MKPSIIVAAVLAALTLPAGAGTLDDVRSRGMVICGANGQLPGFGTWEAPATEQRLNELSGLPGATIFNDPTEVKLTGAFAAKDRFTALQSGDVDVLARNTTWTSFARDAGSACTATGAELLRRPGVHRAQGAQGQFGARAQRCLGLRAAGHHHRAQSRRLFPRQPHEAQVGDVRGNSMKP